MEIKKKYLIGVLALAVVVGGVAGAFIVRYTWQTNMSMQLSVSYELQLQFQDGTPMSSYDWGLFGPGEVKDLICQINYTGNVPDANITWNTVDFPSGWSMSMISPRYWSQSLDLQWTEDWQVMFAVGQVLPLIISLAAEDGAVPDQPETFTLNFTSSEWTP